MALSRLARFENIDAAYRPVVMNWFRDRQGSSGRFEDTEDTALAVMALSGLVDLHEEGNRAYQEMTHLVRPACPVKRCFLGYCSSSSDVAEKIKKPLVERMTPFVQIIDWQFDLRLGNPPLISQIEQISRECQVSVFLVTKDDQIVESSGTLTATPRDNIIFEVGFFAARLGLDRTFLVVEEGTKLPTDWGGILHIPFRDKKDLGDANDKLFGGIKRALNL
jgi:predicted nucleotide-binding protein